MNLASADRREERYFVTRVKKRIPRGKFLISRSYDGRTVFGQLGNALRIEGKELFDRGRVIEVQKLFGLADNVLQAAEEKHFDANGL